MPELPEVETVCRQLRSSILHLTIKNVIINCYDLRYSIPQNLPNLLIGNNFQNIQRRGKYILLFTKTGVLLIHLGMSGKLFIENNNDKVFKHEHVKIEFDKNITLSFVDPRRFGLMLWVDIYDNKISHTLLDVLGIEPLSDDFSADYLFAITRNKRTPVKTFLMDSHIIVGIGNIYACEVLFACKLHPMLPVNKIDDNACEKLVVAIKNILQTAIQQGGTTIKDFMSSDGSKGLFVNKLMVYGRENQPCYVCGTTIKMLKLAQRSTFFCPNCQQ